MAKTLTQRQAELEERFERHCMDHENSDKKINELHSFLLGNDYDKEMNGGLIRLVKKNIEDVESLKRTRIFNRGAIAILSAAWTFIAAMIIYRWDRLFSN